MVITTVRILLLLTQRSITITGLLKNVKDCHGGIDKINQNTLLIISGSYL